jgi:hypothetical protein
LTALLDLLEHRALKDLVETLDLLGNLVFVVLKV